MFRLGHASESKLASLLDQARTSEPTYAAVGASRRGDLPPGFHHDRSEIRLGDGSSFERAREGLRRWQAHVGAGASVHPEGAPIDGATVLVIIGFGPLQAIAPCRVVYVVDDQDRFGLAYGTLPGHPERGEEAFVVARDGDDTVFRITAFSRPADLLTAWAHQSPDAFSVASPVATFRHSPGTSLPRRRSSSTRARSCGSQ